MINCFLPSDAVNVHLGLRIQRRRKALGLTVRELALQLTRTSHEISELESGAEEISVGLLLKLADCLKVPPTYFYEECGETERFTIQRNNQKSARPLDRAYLYCRTINLIFAFQFFTPEQQRTIYNVVKVLSKDYVADALGEEGSRIRWKSLRSLRKNLRLLNIAS